GDIGERVKTVLEEPPALLVLNGGQESAPFLSALYEATLDDGNRPTVEIPARLSPAATVDYSQLPTAEDLLPECLTSATGYQPGRAACPVGHGHGAGRCGPGDPDRLRGLHRLRGLPARDAHGARDERARHRRLRRPDGRPRTRAALRRADRGDARVQLVGGER